MLRGLLYLGLLSLLVVVGCGRKAVPSIATEVRDSIVYKEVPRLVEVPVPGDTVTVTEYIECDSITNKPKPKTIKAKSGKAKVSVNIKADGSLTASGGCDSLKLKLQVMDRELSKWKTKSTTETKIIEVHTPYWYDIAARWISCVSILICALIVFIKLK